MTQDVLKDNLLKNLLKENLISQEKFQELIKQKDLSQVEAIIKKGKLVEEEALTRVKAEVFHFPYIDLSGVKVLPKILHFIPRDLAENYHVVTFDKKENELYVAFLDPANLKAQEAVEFLARKLGLKVRYYLVSENSFKKIVEQYGSLGVEVKEALHVVKEKLEPKEEVKKKEEMEEVVKSAPISKMVSVILKHAVEGRASDIHIEPVGDTSRVRYRIDGILHTSLVLPKYIHSAIISRIKVLANLKIDETRLPQDGRIRLTVSGKDIDFRVSTFPVYQNEKAVMRILDPSQGISTLEELGFSGRNLTIMKENIFRPHGIFLVTGPTGSGKSTTLYAVLNILNQEGVNIVTLEDPVEYFLAGVNQSQVKPEISYTFASGLRSILRQDPNIIMVGEIRDNETAELAVHAGLTGHIVLSTLHTNNAFGAIPRLVDMKVEPFLIASTLNVVIAQRLVRKICNHCKKEVALPVALEKEVRKGIELIPPTSLPSKFKKEKIKFYQGQGCSHCESTGYAGRSAISEVIDINERIKKLIVGKEWGKIYEEFISQGMLTLEQDGIIKALEGITSLEEVLSVTKE